MQYVSTRGSGEKISSAAAIIKGIAADGGLFVPDELPQVSLEFIAGLKALSYEERAERILGCFLSDYTAEEIKGCVARAYGGQKFDDERRAPLKMFDDLAVLELWHGPTSAFKDMALQLLPQLLKTAMDKVGEKATVLILVATSGDTGKAALAGFADVPQTKIMVFYPDGGVSKIQRLQMQTQIGGNVQVMAVKGNFDDAQSGVKKIFGDAAFAAELAEESTKLSSANSINWGRLVPQVVYYFSAYADLLQAGRISLGEEINFTVPTGNFGDILAGYYARLLGLPVHRLVCASNANDVLTEFLQTGVYDRRRPFHKTISPSMDILISSNLERLLYHITGDAAKVAAWMKSLADVGKYDVGEQVLKEIQKIFWAGWADDDTTKQTIKEVYEARDYVIDPHTAVAWRIAADYRRQTSDRRPMAVLSTASPYKFNESVLSAIGVDTTGLGPFALLDKLAALNPVQVPQALAALNELPVLHKGVCACEDMASEVLAFSRRAN